MSGERRGAPFAGWWAESLCDRESARAKALRARMRRAINDVEVLAEPEVQRLARRLGLATQQRWRVHAFCTAVRALAHVEHDSPGRAGSAASRFGAKAGENRRVLSALRFQRIVRAARASDAGSGIIRALPLIGRKCDVAQIGADLFYWSEPVRSRWCFEYFEQITASLQMNEERVSA